MAGQNSTYCCKNGCILACWKIAGSPHQPANFRPTVPSSGRQFIHTMTLPQMLRDWRFHLSQIDEFQKKERLNTISDLLQVANTQFIYIDQDSEWTRQSPLREILFSISILLDSLSRDTSTLDSRIDTTQPSRLSPLDRTLLSTSILISSMTQNGWCPRQVRLLNERFTPTVIFYLASFLRRSSPQDHRNCDQMDHSVPNNADEKTLICACA